MYTCTVTTCWIINSCIYRSEDWCLQDTERLQCYHGYCTQTDWIISMTLQHDTSQLLYVNVHKWHSWSSSDLCISILKERLIKLKENKLIDIAHLIWSASFNLSYFLCFWRKWTAFICSVSGESFLPSYNFWIWRFRNEKNVLEQNCELNWQF